MMSKSFRGFFSLVVGGHQGIKQKRPPSNFSNLFQTVLNGVVQDVSAVKYQRAPNKNENKDPAVEYRGSCDL